MDELLRQILNWREEIERDPAQRLYHRLADALIKTGRPAAALDIAEKGLFIHDKKYLACEEARGAALLSLGRYAKAVETLAPIAKQLGGEARRKLAMALFGAGREEEAKAICREMVQINPFDHQCGRLLVKGREALPAPILTEPPLPDREETAAASPPPEAAPAARTELRVVGPAPPVEAPEEKIHEPRETLEPEPRVESTATSEENVAAEGAPEPAPRRPESGAFEIEGLALHQARDEQKPFDASVAGEAEAVMEKFFGAMMQVKPAMALRVEEGAAAAPADEPGPPVEVGAPDAAVEHDPTAGMNAELEIEDVDVFGDLGGGGVSAVAAAQEGAAAHATTPPIPATETEDRTEPKVMPATENTVPHAKERRWKRLFRGWRERKEDA